MNELVMQEVDLSLIKWDKRYRDDLGNIDGLIESIKEKGIIQPITLDKNFTLLAGERRVTAAREAGLTTIPAVIRETNDEADAREIELYENVFRKDFAWDERVKLIQEVDRLNRLKDVSWSGRRTAELLGYGKSQTADQLRLAAALEVMPELATVATTAQEAFKMLKRLEENAVTAELVSRQQQRLSKASHNFIEIAKSNYRKGDAFKGLSELRTNGTVHFIECDPPYGVNLTEMKKTDGASTVASYQEIPISEYQEFIEDLAAETFRIAGANCWMIMWYGPSNHEMVRQALVKGGWTVGEIPAMWVKPVGQTMQPSTNLANCYEPFFVCRKGSPVLSKQGRSNIFAFTPTAGQKKYHPTERPITLMREILNTFCHVGGVVVVPFLGSGVTLRSCYLEGMSGFGWDLNGEYKDKFLLAVEDDLKHLNGEDSRED